MAEGFDSALLEKIKNGETGAFASLVKRYQQKVYQLCLSMVGPAEAEDAAQSIFISIYQSIRKFEERSQFSTWLYRVAANHCLNLLAKRKREKTDSLDLILKHTGGQLPELTSADVTLARLAEKESVRSILGKMAEEERLILCLREIEGFSYQELTELLDISLDLVKVRLFRARKSFMRIAKESNK